MSKRLLAIYVAGVFSLAIIPAGCQNTATTTNSTSANQPATNSVDVNSSPMTSPSVETGSSVSQTVETKEPDEYSATLTLTAETTDGEKALSLPSLTAEVARKGENRRVAFTLPNNEPVIYLNLNNTRYLIMPNRKQYAELKPGSVGFDLPRLLMPDQIVEYFKGKKGYDRIGEEQFKGRSVVKYRAAGTTQTNTPAGRVNAETFTYVDKETGLPLRAEFASELTGNVQGVKDMNAVVEMRDVKNQTDPALFEVPAGYNKITEEQVRNQVNVLTQLVAAIAGTILNNINAAASPTVSPAAR